MMRIIAALFALGAHSFFAGLFVIAAVFWWHGRDLPSTQQLAEYEPATLSRVYSADGALLAEFSRERRLYTPIDEIPLLVRHAFVSAEDKNFYTHAGVDPIGILKAMVDNARRVASGQGLRGASTITQQVVKNFLLSGDRRVARKVKEALLAWRVTSVLSKEQVLELYLNEIFLGLRSYGVTTAALRYFGKKLEDLTPAEVAYLAALPKAPSTYHPIRRKERAKARRDYVLKEMYENGYITRAEYDEARESDLDTILDDEVRIRAARTLAQEPPPLDFFGEEIRRGLVADLGEERVYSGGLTIRATVDPELQDIARRVLQKRLFEFSQERGYGGPAARLAEDVDLADAESWRPALKEADVARDVAPWRRAVVLEVGERSARIGIEGVESDEPIYLPFSDVREWAVELQREERDGLPVLGPQAETPSEVWTPGDVIFVEKIEPEDGDPRWSMRQIPSINGALVALDPKTGRVLAMQGGFSFDASVFNRATQASRQPGSAIKPFIYAAALEKMDEITGRHKYAPNSIILDAPVVLPQGSGDTDDSWKPRNYSGRFYGPSPLRWGIEKSHNLMTVRLAMDIGLDKVADYTQRFGVYDQMPLLYSYALGSGETTLMRLTASYAMFVNGGRLIQPTFVDRIQNRFGETVFRHDQRICTDCSNVPWEGQAEPYVADEGAQVLDPVTAYQVTSLLEGVTARGTASKIGKALTFDVAGKTGTTNDARDAWFIGFTPELAVGCYIGFDNPRPMGPKASGGKLCAPAFQAFMEEAMGEGPYPEFRRPAGAKLVKIDRESGCVVSSRASGSSVIDEVFRDNEAPQRGDCPRNDFQDQFGGPRSAADRIAQETAAALGEAGVGVGATGATQLRRAPGGGPLPTAPAAGGGEAGAAAQTPGAGLGSGGALPPNRPQRPTGDSFRTDGVF